VEEPATVAEEMRFPVPEVPELVSVESMGERTVPVAVLESGGRRRIRQDQQQPDQEDPCAYRMSQSAAFHRPLSSCLIREPVILEPPFVHL
jgi:hypothetical protein